LTAGVLPFHLACKWIVTHRSGLSNQQLCGFSGDSILRYGLRGEPGAFSRSSGAPLPTPGGKPMGFKCVDPPCARPRLLLGRAGLLRQIFPSGLLRKHRAPDYSLANRLLAVRFFFPTALRVQGENKSASGSAEVFAAAHDDRVRKNAGEPECLNLISTPRPKYPWPSARNYGLLHTT
jgi:hypothetical protein